MLNTDTIAISPEILRIIAEIDEFKGAWRALGKLPSNRLDNLRMSAMVESVGAAARLTGARLEDDAIPALLSRSSDRDLRSKGQQDAAGYAEVYNTICTEFDVIDLSENHIRQLHRDLLYHSRESARHRGVYKTRSAGVDVFGESELALARHAGMVPVGAIPRYMAELVSWTRTELNHGLYHPILVTTIFTAGLLGVKPFEKGNGRLSWLLIRVCLGIAGYNYMPYGSIEKFIEESRYEYNQALRETVATLRDDAPDWQPWLMYILKILLQQKRSIERKINLERQILDDLPPLSELVLEVANERGRVAVADIQKLSGTSRNTIKGHIQGLCRTGRLNKHGAGRGTWYSPA